MLAFADAEVAGTPEVQLEFPALRWDFTSESPLGGLDEEGEAIPAAEVFSAFHDIRGLRALDGALVGTTSGELPVLRLDVAEDLLPSDLLAKIEVRLQIDEGSELHVDLQRRPPELEDVLDQLGDTTQGDLNIALRPGDEMQTYALGEAQSSFGMSASMTQLRSLLIRFTAPSGTPFRLESVRLAGRVEELSKLPSGFGWHGLGHVYRETVVSRSPEQITWNIDVDSPSYLDLAIGSPDDPAVTFHIEATDTAGNTVSRQRTVTERDRWFQLPLDLEGLRGATRVALSLDAENEGPLGFWGGLSLRPRGSSATSEDPTPARQALSEAPPPRGVVLFLADTLRRDHLEAWGYDRETAPTLSALASEGTRFADNISQGTWTKVSVSSILTSLYASTHGISDVPDRVPASVTTLAEAFRDAGYATFHTSSVPFSGKNSNLQQGVEVLHERSSLDLEGYGSKTARSYVDEFLHWLRGREGEPFFAFVHVFDPHSPFKPRAPYDRRWISDEDYALLEEQYEKLREETDFHGLPTAEDVQEAGYDPDQHKRSAEGWYDGSIRAMDLEVARLREALAELGLAEDTLFAFISDHGEEFFERGESWHGQSVYGEMVNVPMFLHWPGVVPATVVEDTTESIDLMPTLLELAQLPVPEQAQGDSLLPLLAAASRGESAREHGWTARPAFTERKDSEGDGETHYSDSYAVVHDGWKLIWNVVRRDERPEFELFEHRVDPLNLDEVGAEHPEVIATLRPLVENWRKASEAARVSDEGLEEDLDPEELERLRALGYVN